MEGKFSQTNKFELYSAVVQNKISGMLYECDVTDEIADNLNCWCCGTLIRDCQILKEEGFTTVAKVRNPDMFANAPENFMKTDSKGRHLYIPLCGVNGYNEEL